MIEKYDCFLKLLIIFTRGVKISWGKLIWQPFIPASRSFLVWTVLYSKLTSENLLQKTGFFHCFHV